MRDRIASHYMSRQADYARRYCILDALLRHTYSLQSTTSSFFTNLSATGNVFVEFICHLRFGHRVENIRTFGNESDNAEPVIKRKEFYRHCLAPSLTPHIIHISAWLWRIKRNAANAAPRLSYAENHSVEIGSPFRPKLSRGCTTKRQKTVARSGPSLTLNGWGSSAFANTQAAVLASLDSGR